MRFGGPQAMRSNDCTLQSEGKKRFPGSLFTRCVGESLEHSVPLWALCTGAMLRCVSGQNRKWLIPVRHALANDSEDQGDYSSEPCAECHEVPQRGKSENENDGTADCEKETDESPADWELMDIDAGMTVFRHSHLLPLACHGAPRWARVE